MQQLREAAVFGAISSSNIFPEAVSNIIVDYVITKEADEMMQCIRLHVNLQNRIHFIHSYLAVWQNDKLRLERMIEETDYIYKKCKPNFVNKPWYMVEYRFQVCNIVELVRCMEIQETSFATYWGNRIPLEFVIEEDDM